MHRRANKKYWIGMVGAALLTLIATVLFYPGFGGSVSPPETIGADVVVEADSFDAGQFSGTDLRPAVNSGGPALALAAARPQGQGQYTSDPVQADYTFNALGLHWLADTPPGARIIAELRFSRDGADWGDWQTVPVDDQELPDKIHDTTSSNETIGGLLSTEAGRYFQYRLTLTGNDAGQSPSISRLTASYIDSMGYHESLLSPARVWGRISAFISPPVASAQPGVISRAQWGADESLSNWDPEYAPVRKQILHHTAADQGSDPAATVRGIYYYHSVSLNWGDIGYNYLVDRSGNIYEGRKGGPGVIGGHALGWNTGSVGISVLGNYENYDITPATYSALVELMTWQANINRISPYGSDYFVHYENNQPVAGYPINMLGHRDTYSTACPGAYLYARMPQFRAEVNARYSPVPIVSPFVEKWDALHGAPGGALAVDYAITGGRAQDFQSGRLINNASTGSTWWVLGGILAKYDSLGKWDGFLGMPTSDEYGAGGRVSNFTGGRIYWSGATNAHVVHGGILERYLSIGGPGPFGFPTTDEYDVPGVSGARESDFQLGRIYWTAADGAHLVYGGIMNKFLSLGSAAVWGTPTNDEYDIPGVAGGRQEDFTVGHILWSPATGAHGSLGSVHAKYIQMGGPAGFLGMPTSDEFAGSTGRAQTYQGGMITYYQPAGTFAIYGGILAKYQEFGAAASTIGPALTDEIDVAGVTGARENDFLGGRIYWSAATGAHATYGGIMQTYLDKGGPASLGLPMTDEYNIPGVTGGRESDFQNARIYYHAATGAHEVYGGIYGKWMEYGGPTGGLGLPVTGEYDVAGGGREGDFQNGRIYWSAGTGAHAVYGGIMQKYLEAGGVSGALGLPTSDEYASGGGRRSDFVGGYIYWSAGTGAQLFVNDATTVTADSTFEVREGNGTFLTLLSAGQTASVRYSGGTYTVTAPGYSHTGSSYIRLNPGSAGTIMQVTSYHDIPSWNPALDDNRFRGSIEVRYSAVSNAVWVIDELPLESYLKGIGETSSGLPTEFLKTMSVAARGYALYHVNRGGKYYGSSQDIFHLKNSRNGNGDDQVYQGYGLESRFAGLASAVDATAGQVVTYGGAPAITTYFSRTDGRTRSAQEAWGVDDWPWLQSVSDPDCAGMTMSGHGVGLSGYGAQKRAERGDSYTAILTYYYSGTAVQAVDTNKLIRVAITSHGV
ncbi:MAG: N-acetylmuramoyl-L-alanine amidase [Thermoleophilia bacterium]